MTHGDTTDETVGGEDVLDGHVPPTPAAGPRTRFNRKRDYVLLAGIVVALAVSGVVVWQRSDIRATESKPSNVRFDVLPAPEFFPPSLAEAWRADSPATWTPVTTGQLEDQNTGMASTVVTGAGGEVAGRDPLTGDVRWTYKRDLDLCTVSMAWKKVVAVYRTDGNWLPEGDPRAGGGCSEVTALKADSGERDAQRNFDAELGTRLLDDGDHVTATGSLLLLTLRSDLVKTMEYGQLPAMVNPNKQPRTGCSYESVQVTSGKIGVIEHCGDYSADQLTVYKASATDSDKPEVISSVVLPGESAQIVAMSGDFTAVALPDPGRVLVYDGKGKLTATHPIDLGDRDLRENPVGRVPLVTTATGAFYWFTGSRTVVLSAADLRPLWTTPDTLGPGTIFAGRALVPVPDGIAVLSQADGARVGTIPVDREGHTGPVTMSSVGPMVLEQRGATLVALH